MSDKNSSYRQIMKATSVFGGVQVFGIIITILRSKIIAILLGTTGMGFVGLLNSTIGFITTLTNFGLGTAAVKNISFAHSSGDETKIGQTIGVFRRLVWFTGLLGLFVTLILSSWLSNLVFGSSDYTYAFVLLSLTLLLTQLSEGQTVILRGMRKIKLLAMSSTLGALFGLIFSVPLYYFFGIDGIVPSMVATALLLFLFTWYFSNKVVIQKRSLTKSLILNEGKEMLRMGFFISLSSLTTIGVSFLVRIYINSYGGVDDVGLYVAGFSLIGNYVAIVLSSMSTDYYPRLAAISDNNQACTREINAQTEIALLILAPILVVFMVFSKWAVVLLYSAKFLPITTMLLWAALGVFFKTISWAIAFIFLAKSSGKIYFWNELLANFYILGFNILGYYLYGLTGLGISFLLAYFLYFVQVYFLSKSLYKFSIDMAVVKIFTIQFLLALICFSGQFFSSYISYSMGFIVIMISTFYSYKVLNKRLDLAEMFKNRLK